VKINPRFFDSVLRPIVFLLLLLPVGILIFEFYFGSLGANPIEYILRDVGIWSLRILILGLILSPLSRLTKWIQVLQLRRMVGLFAFFYALLHLLGYLIFEQALEISSIINDLWERPFIAVGFAAFLTLLPLAITSTRTKMRQMGKHWKPLHRFVYLAVILCVVHFWWSVKADVGEPVVYALVTSVILLERAWRWLNNKKTKP